jgi:ribose 5-phosphate isomerase B
MKIVIGSDHAGFVLKGKIISWLLKNKYEVEDVGCFSVESVDYPDYAHLTSEKVLQQEVMGILLCGSANGVCISANKHPGIRAALCWKKEIAALARQHNDANIICLPARFLTETEAEDILHAFLTTSFEEGRHVKRIKKIELLS